MTIHGQIWLAAALPGAQDVAAAWDLAVADQINPDVVAQNRGSGWQAGSSLANFAFSVYRN